MAVINRIELKDFLVFKGEFSVDFCPGVNVLIGGNGTGKTTLLKCLYGSTDTIAYKTSRYFDAPGFVDSKDDVYVSRIMNMPPEKHKEYSNSHSSVAVFLTPSEEWVKIDNEFHSKVGEIASHSEEGKKLNEEYLSNPFAFNINQKSVMIPSTEMLSHSKGLLAMCYERKMPFDQTQIDILVKAQFPETREIKPNASKVLDKIKALIGGEVVYENDMFFIQKENDGKISFSLEASGYQKLGLLWKLLRNGLIERGTVLLWDEPENSLNPEFVPKLVDILLELSRNGVQIFLATHDYNLARYFDVRKDKNIPVAFHNLTKSGERIVCNSSSEYILLPDNLLEKASADLFDAVVDAALEVQDNE